MPSRGRIYCSALLRAYCRSRRLRMTFRPLPLLILGLILDA